MRGIALPAVCAAALVALAACGATDDDPEPDPVQKHDRDSQASSVIPEGADSGGPSTVPHGNST